VTEQHTQDVVDAFIDAIESRDFDRAAGYLSREQFSYRGPMQGFDDPDDFISDISRVGAILKRIDRRKIFVDGSEVCVIYDFVSTLSELASTRVALWIGVRNGKIASIEVFFDAHAYASMFEQ
jgi:hypothetical protein